MSNIEHQSATVNDAPTTTQADSNPAARTIFLRKLRVRLIPVSSLKYRLAIFDSDGTLADTLPWMRSIFNELAAEHGFRRVEPHEYERYRDLHGHALLHELGLPLWKLPRVMNSLRRRMAEHTGRLSLFPGISDVLHRLAAAKIQLAIVSSNSRENVERVLGADNSKLIVHFACGASMFGKAAKLRQALRRCSVQPPEAIYLGDEIRDAEAAAKTGIAFGAVAWGQHGAEILRTQKPAQFFTTVPEIADKLG
jgi:phosphoglycolate phosphatase